MATVTEACVPLYLLLPAVHGVGGTTTKIQDEQGQAQKQHPCPLIVQVERETGYKIYQAG